MIERFSKEIRKINFFENNPVIGVAISGGSDSTALLVLCHEYFSSIGGRVIAILINHGLRSVDNEIKRVKIICQQLKIHLKIFNLEMDVLSLKSNLQDTARRLRYDAITNYCNENSILHLMTGHTMDDFAENFLLRIFRGSGIFGLSKQIIHYHNQVRIVRPLHNIKKWN